MCMLLKRTATVSLFMGHRKLQKVLFGGDSIDFLILHLYMWCQYTDNGIAHAIRFKLDSRDWTGIIKRGYLTLTCSQIILPSVVSVYFIKWNTEYTQRAGRRNKTTYFASPWLYMLCLWRLSSWSYSSCIIVFESRSNAMLWI